MRRLIQSIVELIRMWWTMDRVRASPREGRLLRLRPGSIVDIAGSRLEITNRAVHNTPHGSLVRYECRGLDGDSTLWVAVSPVPAIRWSYEGDQREVFPDEIETWN